MASRDSNSPPKSRMARMRAQIQQLTRDIAMIKNQQDRGSRNENLQGGRGEGRNNDRSDREHRHNDKCERRDHEKKHSKTYVDDSWERKYERQEKREREHRHHDMYERRVYDDGHGRHYDKEDRCVRESKRREKEHERSHRNREDKLNVPIFYDEEFLGHQVIKGNNSMEKTTSNYASNWYNKPKRERTPPFSKEKETSTTCVSKDVSKSQTSSSIDSTNYSKPSHIKCLKCLGRGHVAFQCPTKKTMISLGHEQYDSEELSSSDREEDECNNVSNSHDAILEPLSPKQICENQMNLTIKVEQESDNLREQGDIQSKEEKEESEHKKEKRDNDIAIEQNVENHVASKREVNRALKFNQIVHLSYCQNLCMNAIANLGFCKPHTILQDLKVSIPMELPSRLLPTWSFEPQMELLPSDPCSTKSTSKGMSREAKVIQRQRDNSFNQEVVRHLIKWITPCDFPSYLHATFDICYSCMSPFPYLGFVPNSCVVHNKDVWPIVHIRLVFLVAHVNIVRSSQHVKFNLAIEHDKFALHVDTLTSTLNAKVERDSSHAYIRNEHSLKCHYFYEILCDTISLTSFEFLPLPLWLPLPLEFNSFVPKGKKARVKLIKIFYGKVMVLITNQMKGQQRFTNNGRNDLIFDPGGGLYTPSSVGLITRTTWGSLVSRTIIAPFLWLKISLPCVGVDDHCDLRANPFQEGGDDVCLGGDLKIWSLAYKAHTRTFKGPMTRARRRRLKKL